MQCLPRHVSEIKACAKKKSPEPGREPRQSLETKQSGHRESFLTNLRVKFHGLEIPLTSCTQAALENVQRSGNRRMTEDAHAALLNSTVSDHFAGISQVGVGSWGREGVVGRGGEGEEEANYIGWLPASHALLYITCVQTHLGQWIQRIDS